MTHACPAMRIPSVCALCGRLIGALPAAGHSRPPGFPRGPLRRPREQQQNGSAGPDWFSLLPYLKFTRQIFCSENLEPVIIHPRTCNFFFKRTARKEQ